MRPQSSDSPALPEIPEEALRILLSNGHQAFALQDLADGITDDASLAGIVARLVRDLVVRMTADEGASCDVTAEECVESARCFCEYLDQPVEAAFALALRASATWAARLMTEPEVVDKMMADADELECLLMASMIERGADEGRFEAAFSKLCERADRAGRPVEDLFALNCSVIVKALLAGDTPLWESIETTYPYGGWA